MMESPSELQKLPVLVVFAITPIGSTLSNAPETPDQYTAISCCLPNTEIHVSTSCAKAPLALRSGIYSN